MRRVNLTASLAVLGGMFVSHAVLAQTEAPRIEDEPVESAGVNTQEQEQEQEQESQASEDGKVVEEVEVIATGTRLVRDDPTARVDIITAEDIKRRGLSTAESIIRSLPQNVSTNNRVNNGAFAAANPLSNVDLEGLGRGVSTANLRGFGEDATLVLLNGKRIAGSGGRLGSFTNLRDIPASSIERIEVSYDNGSAIHGSDAIGGVINIITKRGYTGGQLTARHEMSETGGDLSRINGYFGQSWGTGSLSGTLSYEESSPILSRKAGFVTRDYRDVLGPDGDLRPQDFHRSGALLDFDGEEVLILPPGHNGVGATADDFVAYDRGRDLIDYINPELSSATEDVSFTLSFQQTLFEDFGLRADVLYSKGKSESLSGFDVESAYFTVPETNAFYPEDFYPEDLISDDTGSVDVSYFPLAEMEAGLLPNPTQTAETTQIHYTVGFDYKLSDKVTWVTDVTRSVSTGENAQSQFFDSSFLIVGNEEDLALLEHLNELLASADPDVAINAFGDGTAQNPTIAEFYGLQNSRDGKTVETDVQSYLTGEFFDLPGGEVALVAGAEWRELKQPDSDSTSSGRLETLIGVPPESSQWAVFSELSIPIVGADNAMAGIQALTLTLQLRYDRYDLEGAYGLDPVSEAPILDQVTFDNWAPRIGLAWSPTEDLLVRLSYAEGFKAPDLTDIFSTSVVERRLSNEVLDPLLDDFVTAIVSFGPDPDLKPETSENYSLGLVYTPGWAPGLNLQVDYSKIDLKDRITSGFELSFLLPTEVYGNMPEFFVRDENGTLIEEIDRPINISRRVSETLDTDLLYAFAGDWGLFETGFNLSYVIGMFDQAVPGAEKISFVGKSSGLDHYKAQARFNWSRDAWASNLYVNYTPGYSNNSLRQLEFEPSVESYTTVDLTASYQFQNGLMLRAGASNLLNQRFPFFVSSGGEPYDAQRVDLRGRVVFLEANYDFSGILGNP